MKIVMTKNEKRLLLDFLFVVIGVAGIVWSAFAGISGEKGNIIYGWELWLLLPFSLLILNSLYHAGRLAAQERDNETTNHKERAND